MPVIKFKAHPDNLRDYQVVISNERNERHHLSFNHNDEAVQNLRQGAWEYDYLFLGEPGGAFQFEASQGDQLISKTPKRTINKRLMRVGVGRFSVNENQEV